MGGVGETMVEFLVNWGWAWVEPQGYGLGIFLSPKALTIDLLIGTLTIERYYAG